MFLKIDIHFGCVCLMMCEHAELCLKGRKPSSCKSIIRTKEALLRFTIVSFLGKLIFNGVPGHLYTSIEIAIFSDFDASVRVLLSM